MPETGPTEFLEQSRDQDPLQVLGGELQRKQEVLDREINPNVAREARDPLIKKQLDGFPADGESKFSREPYEHTLGVATIVAQMDLSPEDRRIIIRAALLHDVGKQDKEVAALIQLPRDLERAEKEIVAKHAGYSASMIEGDFKDDEPMVVALTNLHHQLSGKPTYTEKEESGILFDLGLTAEHDLQKFKMLQKRLEAADKVDANSRPRPYREDDETDTRNDKEKALDVAARVFASFAAANFDPETGMDEVHEALRIKYPNMRFVCSYVDSGQAPSEEERTTSREGHGKVVVTYREAA